jgi:hypothetical protein
MQYLYFKHKEMEQELARELLRKLEPKPELMLEMEEV